MDLRKKRTKLFRHSLKRLWSKSRIVKPGLLIQYKLRNKKLFIPNKDMLIFLKCNPSHILHDRLQNLTMLQQGPGSNQDLNALSNLHPSYGGAYFAILLTA